MNRKNNSKTNLVEICPRCHQREHNPRYGTGK